LLELRQEGKVPAELLQEGTLEDLLRQGKEFRARQESLFQAVISGRMPWLLAESALRNPASWAWALHTQELAWVSEEPLNRAAFSVYATNGFAVRQTSAGGQLSEIGAPREPGEVVVDLSALLTLQMLGRLGQAAEYFGCMILPASYGELRIRDADRFGQHQPSREAELRKIRREIDAGRIRILEENCADVIRVDEYADEGDPQPYRLRDLVSPLQAAQKVLPSAVQELLRVAHQPPTVEPGRPDLNLGDKLYFDLMTLRTLANQNLFQSVLDSFSVGISRTQHNELIAELHAYDRAHMVRDTHDALWGAVADLHRDGRIRWEIAPAITNDPECADDNDEPASVHLDAMKLAHHLNKSVVADDRVLQVLAFLERPAGSFGAFGSDCVLQALLAAGKTDAPSIAADYRRLMNWRYRFLVPSPDLLMAWAQESRDNLPGPALIEAAFYLHDCLRDPGLHCGLEQSDPPMPIAAKLVTAWIHSIMTFLGRIWTSGDFAEENCCALTRWVAEEFIPSCPRGLFLHPIGHNIVRVERYSVFTIALVQFVNVVPQERANLALRTFGDALGLDEDEYLGLTADAIGASAGKVNISQELAADELQFSRHMMQIALFHYVDKGIDALHASRFQQLGLFLDVPAPALPEALLGILQSANHANRTHPPLGPLIFIPERQAASVMEIENVLLHPDSDIRTAALVYSLSPTAQRDSWLTPQTLELLEKRGEDLRSSEEIRWRGAAIEAAMTIRDDLYANLRALKQSFVSRYQEGIGQYIGKLLHPGFKTLLNLQPPLWCASDQQDEIKTWMEEAAEFSKLDEALTRYVDRYGYVPLSKALGAPELVRLWMKRHPGCDLTWEALWSWAVKTKSPLARYHAITVALHIPILRPNGSLDAFWSEIVDVLDVIDESELSGSRVLWQLRCDLASHYARYIEALHAGQHGERVACYAWWLSHKLAETLGNDESLAKLFQERALAREIPYSYFRWTVTRSPIVPSPLRHLTLQVNSIWAMSLLAHLGATIDSFASADLPAALKERIGKVFQGYLVMSNLAEQREMREPVFAFQENEGLERLCTTPGCVPEENREMLSGLISFRRALGDIEKMRSLLEEYLELPVHVQRMTALALKDMVYSSTKYDVVLAQWLDRSSKIAKMLRTVDPSVLEPLLEAMAEFQQHQVANWPTRLPHVLAYAIEQTNDAERAGLLCPHILQMSINAGVVSPVHRIANTRSWPEWRSKIAAWRENLAEVARHSEPWVAARVRGISAPISRLIGPRIPTRESQR
jgi:hypothetical protein